MRVLLDTNVFVSYLLTPGQAGSIDAILNAFLDGRFTLLLPKDVMDEMDEVVRERPQLARRVLPERLNRFHDQLASLGEVVPSIDQAIPRITRDRKDDYLIAYAVVAAADYLVSGDKDLLTLGEIAGVRIVTTAAFAALLSER